VWKQRLEAVSNPEGPHFHVGMAVLAGYAQHMRQRLHSSSLEQHVEELRHANDILRSGMPPPSDQDRELQVAYRRLSEAEHGWHYFCQQLDAAREMLDECTHAIIRLEHHVGSRILSSRRGRRRSPISSSSFRCHLHPQRLQHPLSPTQSQTLMRHRLQTCWEGRVD
jgi:hypothetical protein